MLKSSLNKSQAIYALFLPRILQIDLIRFDFLIFKAKLRDYTNLTPLHILRVNRIIGLGRELESSLILFLLDVPVTLSAAISKLNFLVKGNSVSSVPSRKDY